MIEENVQKLLSELAEGNCFKEPVTLVAATKTRTAEEILRAIGAGITDIGENKVQEFREKSGKIQGARQHFIGHLQLNKVKYVAGKVCLIHSVDRDELAREISVRAGAAGAVQDALVQINIGCEATKGGYAPEEGLNAFERMTALPNLRPVGFMAMLPLSDDESLLSALAEKMRKLYDEAKKAFPHVRYLSMGMSGDWKLCLGHGANMIRLGTAIFGERHV